MPAQPASRRPIKAFSTSIVKVKSQLFQKVAKRTRALAAEDQEEGPIEVEEIVAATAQILPKEVDEV